MTEPDLIFAMGSYDARIPRDRHYTDNHLWMKRGDDVFTVGFTAYSVRLLQDVYFLDWQIDEDTEVTRRQPLGEIESSKAVSALAAPMAGRVLTFNPAVLDDPSAINTDGYGDGWLYRFRPADASESELLTPDEYLTHLEANWEKTQRMIKGQVNTD